MTYCKANFLSLSYISSFLTTIKILDLLPCLPTLDYPFGDKIYMIKVKFGLGSFFKSLITLYRVALVFKLCFKKLYILYATSGETLIKYVLSCNYKKNQDIGSCQILQTKYMIYKYVNIFVINLFLFICWLMVVFKYLNSSNKQWVELLNWHYFYVLNHNLIWSNSPFIGRSISLFF